ncbi:magnesium chelatase subunit ChlD-like protein [Ectothiorhodospira mobilis]|uniref:Magnesium chelatase subunit ChlD-like protein n=1 Tax=Ectothiorhodospira mobilis TaxID=195064 RepID=A0A1I4SQW3_ECTMO|nr:VWA domain-containing protein [Ectothiorhodospira mobilis]SFM66767.1 magnesium chelatase subunit ChlD-like protein [Ectothiorhodospira mobilis]
MHRHRHGGGDVLYCLVLDCSASMLRSGRLSLAKGLLAGWLQQIYRQRAQVAVVGFSGREAWVIQAPARAGLANEHWIAPISGGGGTPMGQGLDLADRIMKRFRRRVAHAHIGVWLLTDGRVRRIPPAPVQADFCTIVDFETGRARSGGGLRIARAWDAAHCPADTFEVDAH